MQSVVSRRLIIRGKGFLRALCFQPFVLYPSSNSVFAVSAKQCVFLLESEFFNLKLLSLVVYRETIILRILKPIKLKYKKL